MRKLLCFILIFLMNMFIISALCEEDQININTATKTELDELYGIGPVKAQAIIDSRPFDSVENLINVPGIGEVTLEKIKEQGLACVEKESEEKEENKEKEEENKEEQKLEDSAIKEVDNAEKEIETINLTKNIKTNNNKENSDKSNYAAYGLILFCILLGVLFILKKQKNYKTEFE